VLLKLVPRLVGEFEFEKPVWLDGFGNYNRMPTPSRKVDEGTFWYAFHCHPINYMEFRQVMDDPNGPSRSMYIFWGNDAGYAIEMPGKWTFTGDQPARYVDSVVYHLIGCEHDFEEVVDPANLPFMHSYKCCLCGHIHKSDSSD